MFPAIVSALLLCAASAPAQQPAPLVSERLDNGEMALSKDGLLHLSKSRGWVRTRAILSDFTLTTEFRLGMGETDAGVGIRTINVEGEWPSRGYRVTLSPSVPAGELRSMHYKSRLLESGDLRAPVPGQWHSLQISARGTTVIVTIDGQLAGSHEIEVRAGSITFDARRGTIEFRSIAYSAIDDASAIGVKQVQLRKDITPPRLVREFKPRYSIGAMARRVEGLVTLEAVVLADGTVGPVKVIRFLDPELEHQSLAALRRWKFQPAAALDGAPVAATVEIEMSFTLSK
jgi:TonB family protein